MSDLIVDRVSKRYRMTPPVARQHTGGLRTMLRRLRPPSAEFWALRDVSFEVARGETLGIIGDNGAGKSTILKLLSGVTSPTIGEITARGRISALIEVGSGFHPELTGRENIFLSGSILGMRRREISEKLERIIDFAGVREFIDTPVKRYSSGMYLRLGFSIAAHLEPDILLLDEVLAVGDQAFQARCLERVDQLHRHGRTIVFISHDLAAIDRLCRRVLLLSKGRVLADGAAFEVVEKYREMVRSRTDAEASPVPGSRASGEADIVSVQCLDRHGDVTSVVRTGDAVTMRVHYHVHTAVADGRVDLYLFTMLDDRYGPWCHLTTADAARREFALPQGEAVVEFSIDELGLLPGICHVHAEVARRNDPGRAMGSLVDSLVLRVEPGPQVRGTFYLPHRWRVGTVPPAGGEAPAGRPARPPD